MVITLTCITNVSNRKAQKADTLCPSCVNKHDLLLPCDPASSVIGATTKSFKYFLERMRTIHFYRVTAERKSKMALNVTKLLNSTETDRNQINILLVEHLLENCSDGNDTNLDFKHESSDEKQDFDFCSNGYDTAMEMTSGSVETVLDELKRPLTLGTCICLPLF